MSGYNDVEMIDDATSRTTGINPDNNSVGQMP